MLTVYYIDTRLNHIQFFNICNLFFITDTYVIMVSNQVKISTGSD